MCFSASSKRPGRERIGEGMSSHLLGGETPRNGVVYGLHVERTLAHRHAELVDDVAGVGRQVLTAARADPPPTTTQSLPMAVRSSLAEMR